MERKFLICNKCGNLIEMINDSSITPFCCQTAMEEIIAKESDPEKGEKHLPTLSLNGLEATISVGEILHPMTEEHHIKWIYVETNQRKVRYDISSKSTPIVKFTLNQDENIINIFAYCNLHGLWLNRISTK